LLLDVITSFSHCLRNQTIAVEGEKLQIFKHIFLTWQQVHQQVQAPMIAFLLWTIATVS